MAVRTFLDDFTSEWDYSDDRGAHVLYNPDDVMTRLCVHWFSHTQGSTLGDATSTQGLLVLPPGPMRILAASISNSAWGSSRTLDIGWQANEEPSGTAIAADLDGLVAAKDVSAALVGWNFNVTTAFVVLRPSKPLKIISTVAGGTIPAAATLAGWVMVARP